ncbi:DNA replication protein [Rhizobium helianthi]|uniref:DNA replication protein n=1 Tax=Rhizobium helianthi TaxID=1132695 RepID=A0ABW4M5W6_9HYPH
MPFKTEKHLGASAANPVIGHRSPAKARQMRLCHPASLSSLQLCALVRELVREMLQMQQDGWCAARGRNALQRHTCQIAIYVCVVGLSIRTADVAAAFGRNRSTVRHACMRVEDQRDQPAYDRMVERIERVVGLLFSRPEAGHGE